MFFLLTLKKTIIKLLSAYKDYTQTTHNFNNSKIIQLYRKIKKRKEKKKPIPILKMKRNGILVNEILREV